MFDEIEYYKKSLVKRIFFLRQAEQRAQNPEMKKLWDSKKQELLTNYLKQK